MSATDALTDLTAGLNRLDEAIKVAEADGKPRRVRGLEHAHLRVLQARADIAGVLEPHEVDACRAKGQIP